MPNRRAVFTHWLPVVLWMTLIFLGSTDVLSAPHTSRFVVPFLKWLLGSHYTLGKLAVIHWIIRKGGHLTEYAILASLTWRALGSQLGGLRDWPRFATALGVAALYACSDEFHQSFIPTRTASLGDVVIDSLGALLALSALLFWHRRGQPVQAGLA